MELPVLHTMKNEEKVVDHNSLGTVGEERVNRLAGDAHRLLVIFLYHSIFCEISMYNFNNQEKPSNPKKNRKERF